MVAALGSVVAAYPAGAQDSRSLQDMLSAAVRLGDVGAVRSLLSAGADVAKRGNNGKTAIDLAIELGRFDIAELLVQERPRQRDAAIAAPSSNPQAEVIQESAEAAPEVVPQRVAIPPRTVSSSAPLASSPSPVGALSIPNINTSQATADQLLAMAQQLTAAAQAMTAAQRPSAPVRTSLVQEFDIPPTPGRKPFVPAQAARPANTAVAAAETVVVTPRRRSVEDGADRMRNSLESGQDLPVNPPQTMPSVPLSPPNLPVAATIKVQPTRAPAADSEEPNNGLIRAVKGIGGFLGIGSGNDAKKSDATDDSTSLQSPSHASRTALLRDQQKRDRNMAQHVPARRASEYQSPLNPPNAQPATPAQQQSSLPPVKAMPVTPVTEQPLPAVQPQASVVPPATRLTVRKTTGLDPFDPDNMPQGSVLPLTDPLGGNAPEIARPKALALEATPEEKIAVAEQESSLRETLRQSASSSQRAAKPQAAAPAVPPMADPAARPAEPTAVFERRQQQATPISAPKPEGGILKNLANAVGLSSSDDEMPTDAAPGAQNTERLTTKQMPILSLRQPLADVRLTLGDSVATDQRPLPRGVAEPDPCIKRSGGALMFCVVPVDWHPKVDPAFAITTYLYQGSRAIARYDGGKATHYHALFNSLAYDDVVKYFTVKYGPPTDEWKRSIAPFDRARQPNPTMVWRSRDMRTNKITILEVRRYDDTRNVFPDMEHGAVRLYAAGAQRVFPVVTGMDLMGIDWAARSDHTDSANDPALANTIRVGR